MSLPLNSPGKQLLEANGQESLDGFQSQSGRKREEKHLMPLPGIELRIVDHTACSLIPIPTELYRNITSKSSNISLILLSKRSIKRTKFVGLKVSGGGMWMLLLLLTPY